MSWLTDRHYFLLAVAAYGMAALYSVFLWRRGFRAHDRVCFILVLAGFGLQFTAMLMRGLAHGRCPVNNLYEAVVFVDAAIAAACVVIGAFPRFTYLCAFAAPVLLAIGIFGLMPGLDAPALNAPPRAALVSLHASLTLLSYGAFGLAFAAGIMYLTQERDLKLHKLRAVLAALPPIERLERIIGRLLWSGLLLLTAGLALVPFLPHDRAEHVRGDPKAIWSVIIWAGYLTLLSVHGRLHHSGRRFAWGAVGAFAFVLLTFWGVNLLSPAHRF